MKTMEPTIPTRPLTGSLSPLQYGPTAPKAHIRQTAIPGIGFVTSISAAKDADDVPLRFTDHLVGIRCEHWAPDAERTGDCRFGCLKR